MNKFFAVGLILGIAIILLHSSQTVNALTRIIASGDFGGKSDSITNLKNIDNTGSCFIGIGDYMYDKHPSTKVDSTTLGQLWDNIICKIGGPGNHEELKHQEEEWAEQAFQYSSQGYSAWSLNDVGIIILSAYADFDKGSKQYDFVLEKSKKLDQDSTINQIVYVTHEPLWTPSYGGGHGPNTDLRNTFAEIIKSYNGFLIQAHNHGMGFGNVEGVDQALCGGGGYSGDTLEKLNGWEWATTKSGYCSFEFGDNQITARAIDTNNKVLNTQVFRPTGAD